MSPGALNLVLARWSACTRKARRGYCLGRDVPRLSRYKRGDARRGASPNAHGRRHVYRQARRGVLGT